MKHILFTLTFVMCIVGAIAQGTITNIRVSQGTDTDLRLVDILFDLSGSDLLYDITLEVSFNDGGDYVAIDNANVTGNLTVEPNSDIHLVWDGRVSYPTQTADLSRIKITATTHVLAVGDELQGGIIAYILQSGDPGYVSGEPHGLIAAASDLDGGTSFPWWNGSYTTTGATATALGTGNANTNTIVSIQGAGSYAASLCADLVLNGYSDWYLPSKDELNKLYLNKTAVGGFVFTSSYWCSSENVVNIAWGQGFGNGYQYVYFKHHSIKVRAIRSF